jgi:hypothetical protein
MPVCKTTTLTIRGVAAAFFDMERALNSLLVSEIKHISSFVSSMKFTRSGEGELSTSGETPTGAHRVQSCPPLCAVCK